MYCTIDAQEHLKFKGIEINGNVNTFGKLLEKDGFKLISSKGNRLDYSGDFASYANCEIIILGSNKTSTIWKVVVFFPDKSTWSETKSLYKELKEQFSFKYGIGESFEFFKDPYKEGDGYELQAISLDKGNYSTFWKVQHGSLMVSISSSGQVYISYEDQVNSDLDTIEKKSIMNNDI